MESRRHNSADFGRVRDGRRGGVAPSHGGAGDSQSVRVGGKDFARGNSWGPRAPTHYFKAFYEKAVAEESELLHAALARAENQEKVKKKQQQAAATELAVEAPKDDEEEAVTDLNPASPVKKYSNTVIADGVKDFLTWLDGDEKLGHFPFEIEALAVSVDQDQNKDHHRLAIYLALLDRRLGDVLDEDPQERFYTTTVVKKFMQERGRESQRYVRGIITGWLAKADPYSKLCAYMLTIATESVHEHIERAIVFLGTYHELWWDAFVLAHKTMAKNSPQFSIISSAWKKWAAEHGRVQHAVAMHLLDGEFEQATRITAKYKTIPVEVQLRIFQLAPNTMAEKVELVTKALAELSKADVKETERKVEKDEETTQEQDKKQDVPTAANENELKPVIEETEVGKGEDAVMQSDTNEVTLSTQTMTLQSVSEDNVTLILEAEEEMRLASIHSKEAINDQPEQGEEQEPVEVQDEEINAEEDRETPQPTSDGESVLHELPTSTSTTDLPSEATDTPTANDMSVMVPLQQREDSNAVWKVRSSNYKQRGQHSQQQPRSNQSYGGRYPNEMRARGMLAQVGRNFTFERPPPPLPSHYQTTDNAGFGAEPRQQRSQHNYSEPPSHQRGRGGRGGGKYRGGGHTRGACGGYP